MKFLRKILDKQEKLFEKGGKLEKFFPLWEANDTFLYTPGKVTPGPSHIRDAMDFKRMMMTVVYALIPAVLMALYNTGYQANLAINSGTGAILPGWRTDIMEALGFIKNASIVGTPDSILSSIVHGALYFLPIYIVTLAAGGFWEILFGCVRKHDIQEGFLVTSLLFPLILPPTIPLWQVAIGISFGVVLGKEVFGGVGMNIFNPALVARAFLFFAYPAQLSGNAPWVAVDGFSSATPLAHVAGTVVDTSANAAPVVIQATKALGGANSWWDAFYGLIPGSMGETSTLACLLGGIFLVITGIGSWRIMVSLLAGMSGTALLFNLIGSDTNIMFGVNPMWHLVLGGFAFGTIFMATDPVSAAITTKGKYLYGVFIGIVVVLVRVINPAFPEGMMLAILFGNMFAPLVDRIIINLNIRRRKLRNVN